MGKTYYIHIKGQLSEHWSRWFEGLAISAHGNDTLLQGLLADEAALWGVLARIPDLGLTLLSMRSDDEATHDTVNDTTEDEIA